MYSRKERKFISFDKQFGWDALEENTMLSALSKFLDDGISLRLDVVPYFLKRLEQVRDFVLRCGWQFYASSLLFVYDSADVPNAHEPVVYMVDFAHAFKLEEPNSGDEGYCSGVDSLTRFLKNLVCKPKL